MKIKKPANTLSIDNSMRHSKSHKSMKEFHQTSFQFATKRYMTVLASLLDLGANYQDYVRSEMDTIKALDPADRTWLNSAAAPKIIETLKLIRKTKISIAEMHARMFD